jgi:hypothetical protein
MQRVNRIGFVPENRLPNRFRFRRVFVPPFRLAAVPSRRFVRFVRFLPCCRASHDTRMGVD